MVLATGTASVPWDGVTRTDPDTGESEVAFASSFTACGDGEPFEIPEDLPWFPLPGWEPPVLPLCMPLQNHDLIGQSMDVDGTLIVGSRTRGLTTYEEVQHPLPLSLAGAAALEGPGVPAIGATASAPLGLVLALAGAVTVRRSPHRQRDRSRRYP